MLQPNYIIVEYLISTTVLSSHPKCRADEEKMRVGRQRSHCNMDTNEECGLSGVCRTMSGNYIVTLAYLAICVLPNPMYYSLHYISLQLLVL